MKTLVLVGWADAQGFARVCAATQRRAIEAETTLLHSHPGPNLDPVKVTMEVFLPETKETPKTATLYESELHPGLFLDEHGNYFRVAYVNMEMNCPYCGFKHVDKPEPGWDNPPHRTHFCHNCKKLWRPANIHTFGVVSI